MVSVIGSRSAIATSPVSRPISIFITITPLSASPAMMARLIGAAPRHRAPRALPLMGADIHLHPQPAALGVAGHDGAVDRCGAAPARQQRAVQIEAAELWCIENGLRQGHGVGHE